MSATAADSLPGLGSPTGTGTGAGGSTTRRAGMFQSPVVRRASVDVAALSVLFGLGIVAFGPVFGSYVGYLAAGGGVALGAAVAGLSAWRSWSRLGTLLAAMVGYLMIGGPVALPSTTIAGVVPTAETFQRLTLLSWQSWRDLLTVALPAGQFDGPAVLPFGVGLITSTLGFSAVLRMRRVGWLIPSALICPLALLLVGILWGSHNAPFASMQGGLLAAVALAWVAWRTQLGDTETHALYFRTSTNTRAPRTRRAITAVLSLAVAVVASVGAWALLSPEPDRHVLRDDVVPPLDLRAYPSPLTGYRHLEAALEKEVLFTVDGLPQGAFVRLAAMDLYDGDVYNVTEESAAFEQAGAEIQPGQFSDEDAEVSALTFTIGKYDGVWLPGGGDLRGVEFTRGDTDAQRTGLFYNPATGTALTTAGVREGSAYTVKVALPRVYDDTVRAELPGGATPDATFPIPTDPVRVESVGNKVGDFSADASTPMDQLRAIESAFRKDGFYANGTDKSVPSYAGHTVNRIKQLLESQSKQIIGDDEQYAVAMSLMARELNLPSRVVMGFYPDPAKKLSGTVVITGDDAHVWTEVLFEGLGWVAFQPTPDEDQNPEINTPKPNPRNEPQMLPPPEVPEDRDPREPPRADSEVEDDSTLETVLLVLKYVAIGIGLLALLLGPFVLVGILKGRRRLRRRNAGRLADRISGGWSEIIDLATDLGVRVPPEATRFEAAMAMGDRIPTASGASTAQRVDGHVFGAAEPTDTDVEAVWAAVDGLRTEFRDSASRGDRFRARFSPRSLLHRPSLTPADALAQVRDRLGRLRLPRFRRKTA